MIFKVERRGGGQGEIDARGFPLIHVSGQSVDVGETSSNRVIFVEPSDPGPNLSVFTVEREKCAGMGFVFPLY